MSTLGPFTVPPDEYIVQTARNVAAGLGVHQVDMEIMLRWSLTQQQLRRSERPKMKLDFEAPWFEHFVAMIRQLPAQVRQDLSSALKQDLHAKLPPEAYAWVEGIVQEFPVLGALLDYPIDLVAMRAFQGNLVPLWEAHAQQANIPARRGGTRRITLLEWLQTAHQSNFFHEQAKQLGLR